MPDHYLPEQGREEDLDCEPACRIDEIAIPVDDIDSAILELIQDAGCCVSE